MTIALDDETARWARTEAARQETSVSQLIAGLLRERMLDGDYEAARQRYVEQEARVHRAPGRRYPGPDELHERDRHR
jgi:hypothetical protein